MDSAFVFGLHLQNLTVYSPRPRVFLTGWNKSAQEDFPRSESQSYYRNAGYTDNNDSDWYRDY